MKIAAPSRASELLPDGGSGVRWTVTKRIAIGIVGLVIIGSGIYFAKQSGTAADVYRNDFNVYYFAAREVIAGRDPYQRSLGDWTPYIYPPLLSELMIPLAGLSLPVAAYFWFLISAGSVLAAAKMSAALNRKSDVQCDSDSTVQNDLIALLTVVVVMRFALDTFSLGQVNAIVVALGVAHLFFYSRDKKWLSAISLILAVSIKLTPAVLLVYHIAKLRLKFVAACSALLVGLTVLSFVPFGSQADDVFKTFWNRTIHNEQGYDFAYSGNQSLRGAIERLEGNSDKADDANAAARKPSDTLTFIVSIIVLVLAVFAATKTDSLLYGAAPFFCCAVILSPLSWKAHYVMLILPIACLLHQGWKNRASRWWVVFSLLVTFLLFNLTSPKVIGLTGGEWADAHSLVFAGAVIVYVAGLIWSAPPSTETR
jgi:hypothetical protein